MAVTTPITRRNIPEHLDLQQRRFENLKCHMNTVRIVFSWNTNGRPPEHKTDNHYTKMLRVKNMKSKTLDNSWYTWKQNQLPTLSSHNYDTGQSSK